MRRFVAAVFLVGLTAGCSSGGTSDGGTASGGTPSGATGSPAVCSSTHALQTSVGDLAHVQVDQNGLPAVQDSLAAVKSDLQHVVDDASSQYATQVAQLKDGLAAVQAAAGAAVGTPSADSLNAVAASIRALGDDVSGFANDLSSTC